jgi:hypothetical protein
MAGHGADCGIDVISAEASTQVKHYANTVGDLHRPFGAPFHGMLVHTKKGFKNMNDALHHRADSYPVKTVLLEATE